MTPIAFVSARAGDAPAARTKATASQRRDDIGALFGSGNEGPFRSPMMKKASTSGAFRASRGGENRRALVSRAERAAKHPEQFAPHADMGLGEIGLGMRSVSPNVAVDQHVEPARRRVETNDVAVPDFADCSARRRFRGHMDRRGNLARGAGQAPV